MIRSRLGGPSLVLWLALALFGCQRQQPKLDPLMNDAILLAFGDSLTPGTGAAPGEDYPSILSRSVGLPVINAGIAGELSGEGLARLARELEHHPPDLLILIHGGNDLLQKVPDARIEQNLRAMIALARQNGVAVVMLGVPTPSLFGLLDSAPFYARVAEDLQVPIDTESLPEILSTRALKADTVHPNAAGYRLLAERVHVLLQACGALRTPRDKRKTL